MLNTWRRMMTAKLLALSALGLVAIVAFVALGFWHRRQLDADLEGHGEHRADRWAPDAKPFTVRAERAEQDAFTGADSYGDGEFAGSPDED